MLSTLVQAMACRLLGANHYLNQCWFTVNETPGNKCQWIWSRKFSFKKMCWQYYLQDDSFNVLKRGSQHVYLWGLKYSVWRFYWITKLILLTCCWNSVMRVFKDISHQKPLTGELWGVYFDVSRKNLHRTVFGARPLLEPMMTRMHDAVTRQLWHHDV